MFVCFLTNFDAFLLHATLYDFCTVLSLRREINEFVYEPHVIILQNPAQVSNN